MPESRVTTLRWRSVRLFLGPRTSPSPTKPLANDDDSFHCPDTSLLENHVGLELGASPPVAEISLPCFSRTHSCTASDRVTTYQQWGRRDPSLNASSNPERAIAGLDAGRFCSALPIDHRDFSGEADM